MAKADQVWQVGRAVSRLFYWPATGFAQFGPWSRGFQGGLRLARFEAMMKLYFFYNDAFALLKESFIASIKDPFELKGIDLKDLELKVFGNLSQIKLNFVIGAVKDNIGDVIVISDVDILFFNEVIPTIEREMVDKDILFQSEHGSLDYCSKNAMNIGFMVIRCSSVTYNFWLTVAWLTAAYNMWDQAAVNDLTRKARFNIRWGFLPDSFWSASNRNRLPDFIHIFHFNRGARRGFDSVGKHNALKAFESKVNARQNGLYLNLGDRPVNECKYGTEL